VNDNKEKIYNVDARVGAGQVAAEAKVDTVDIDVDVVPLSVVLAFDDVFTDVSRLPLSSHPKLYLSSSPSLL